METLGETCKINFQSIAKDLLVNAFVRQRMKRKERKTWFIKLSCNQKQKHLLKS